MISRKSSPQQVKQYLVQTITAHNQGQISVAIKGYKAILKVDPQNRAAKMFYGIALNQNGQAALALKYLDEVVKSAPDNVDVHYHLAAVYQSLGKREDALSTLDSIISKQGTNSKLLSKRAQILAELGQAEKGLQDAQKAIVLDKGYAEAYLHEGLCYAALVRYDDAISSYKQALTLNPQYAEAYNNIGTIFLTNEKYDDAIKYFQQALDIRPDYASAHNNLGLCYFKLEEYERALQCFNVSIEHRPSDASTIANLASVTQQLGDFKNARKYYEKALKYNTSLRNVFSSYLMCLHYMEESTQAEIFKAHKNFDKLYMHDLKPEIYPDFPNPKTTKRIMKIGFLASNLNRHPVGYMITTALENLDKDKFEIHIYCDLILDKYDDLTARIKEVSEVWNDVRGLSEQALFDQVRSDEIDILIDLTGHAEAGQFLPVIARRAAPVQVKWVGGLFNTTGVSEMDWIFADKIEVPEGEEKWYTEKVYRMPDDYVCYEPPYYAPDVNDLPALKNGFVTFGNLNNPRKTNDYTLGLWAKVLKDVPGSKLLSSGKTYKFDDMRERFERVFAEHGIEKDRLIFEYGGGHFDFISTYHRIDIALDPYPYSGGLSTCEALWMGVPVIALPGPTFAGKHAATHLYNTGLSEWIKDSAEDYVEWACKWASDLDGLSKLRISLRKQVQDSPLVDGAKFAKNLEKAFYDMWNEWIDKHG